MRYLFIQCLFMAAIYAVTLNFCSAQTNDNRVHFRAADTNSDGKVSFEEFKRHVGVESFNKIDRNSDKKIDKQEWQAADRSPKADGNYEAADKNRDNSVSFLEFSSRADKGYNHEEIFNELDRNRDGSLAPDEFNARPAFNILSIRF